MSLMLVLALSLAQPKATALSPAHVELQGVYDELSQAALVSHSESDIDDFHDVFYTPQWTFVDTSSSTHTWEGVRADMVSKLQQPGPDWIKQSIQKVDETATDLTAVVEMIVTRTIVDADGRYGTKGAAHSITETTTFRDTWVKPGFSWQCEKRQQVTPTRQVVGPAIAGT